MREEGRRVRRANLKNIGQIKQRLLGGKERERSTELSGGDVGVSGTREGGISGTRKGGISGTRGDCSYGGWISLYD